MAQPRSRPSFRSVDFLMDHARMTWRFYHPRCLDHSHGGYYQFFMDDGRVYDSTTRHLVSSARLVFNYAMAARYLCDHDKDKEAMVAGVRHGVAALQSHHYRTEPSGPRYIWVVKVDDAGVEVLDGANHCYGLAFVLLAYAHAVMAGVIEARPWMEQVYNLMEEHFWQAQHGLYADEASMDWSTLSPYRGQNANMHACEAMLACHEATGGEDSRYLARALELAHNMTVRQSFKDNPKGPYIWEHYREDWSPDMEYNKGEKRKTNIFRPWGFQPGHHMEWAKLLLTLDRFGARAQWLVPRAKELFIWSVTACWDHDYGGLVYSVAPDGSFYDPDKYWWVQCEALAAAALLAKHAEVQEGGGEEPAGRYWEWYDKVWEYCWKYFVDHKEGAWWRILSRCNEKYSEEKSPAGKCDYHTIGMCLEVALALQRHRHHKYTG